jgi:hypothetical protein
MGDFLQCVNLFFGQLNLGAYHCCLPFSITPEPMIYAAMPSPTM